MVLAPSGGKRAGRVFFPNPFGRLIRVVEEGQVDAPDERDSAMTDVRLKRFQWFVRAWSYASLALFATLLVSFTLRAPVLDHGGALKWAIWDDVGGHVGPMLFVIYMTWAVFLIRASRDPWQHSLFFDFTVWANVAHGVLMIVQMAFSHHDAWKIFTDVPWILGLSAGIALLRPDRKQAAPVSGGTMAAAAR
jgi:hypothetical protein